MGVRLFVKVPTTCWKTVEDWGSGSSCPSLSFLYYAARFILLTIRYGRRLLGVLRYRREENVG